MSGKPSLLSTFDHGSILFLFAATIGFLSDRYFHLPCGIAQLGGALLVSLAIIAIGALFAPFDITDLALLRPLPKAKADESASHSRLLSPTHLRHWPPIFAVMHNWRRVRI
jgi:hypothetical protein